MVAILILAQGGLAQELLTNARTISGHLEECEALALGWHDDLEKGRAKVSQALERLDHGDGVLILTDMYGSTPSNVALSLRSEGRIEVITGVNLPMVVRLGCMTSNGPSSQAPSLSQLASWIRDKGRDSICGAKTPCMPAAPLADCGDLDG